MTWRKNEATAARRRCILNVAALADGAWADSTVDLTGKVFVRLGDASYVAASGTLTNVRKPLVQADDTFTVDDSTDVVTLSTADPATGSGPFRLTTTGTLPAGLATGTDYWWIHTGTKTGKLAATLAGALAGTAIDITDTGTGTHTIADTAATEQLVAGKWLYEATQVETNVDVNEIEVAVLDDTYYAQTFVQIEQGDDGDIATVASGMTRDDLLRGIFTMVACKMLGVDAVRAASGNGDVTFYKADGITPSIVITYSSDGRPTVAFLDLTA